MIITALSLIPGCINKSRNVCINVSNLSLCNTKPYLTLPQYYINGSEFKDFETFITSGPSSSDCYMMNIHGHTRLTGHCEYLSSNCEHCNITSVPEIDWTLIYLFAIEGIY